jgi:hypothetical protein
MFNALQLENDCIFNDDIDPVAAIEPNSLALDR